MGNWVCPLRSSLQKANLTESFFESHLLHRSADNKVPRSTPPQPSKPPNLVSRSRFSNFNSRGSPQPTSTLPNLLTEPITPYRPPQTQDELVTLNGKVVLRQGETLITKAGFSEADRKVDVHFEELFYLPGKDEGLRVLCVSQVT